MKKTVNLIFPHQLFPTHPLLGNGHIVYLIEESLFFRQFRFHKQKIAFHRASMKYYEHYLTTRGITVYYVDTGHVLSDIENFHVAIADNNITTICYIDPTDDRLSNKIQRMATHCDLKIYPSPQFLNHPHELSSFFRPDKKLFFQTTFYRQQRIQRHILLDANKQPRGGKWTYDTENRKKYPKSAVPPSVPFPSTSSFWTEALTYTQTHFQQNPGQLSTNRLYPITHQEATDWLEAFLTDRFFDFGRYEDAIVKEHAILHHSVLSPLLNTGLLLPKSVVSVGLLAAQHQKIPLNSVEGFIRQIIGWREFIRGMYSCKGNYARTRNFWNFSRTIPASFYDGSTGIEPVDHTIKRVLKTGYCHHIERLMILGNFMLLCEFDPDEVYRWFMTLFIDAYDWVMVPNVYGMSQFADGGTFATKPYVGGANYLRKMSNYPPGDWTKVWDGLFWRFIDKQQDFFKANPRTSMLYYTYHNMTTAQRNEHLEHAEAFIASKLPVV